MNTYSHIDTPFNLRYTCWFCGEPSSNLVEFPKTVQAVAKIGHSPIALPACNECARINYSKNLTSIWSVRDQIKHTLIDKYAKHLGIGENWTEQELIDSDFSGSTLGGFGRSAWKMYQIAKQRVDYKGWPLSVDDIPLEVYDETSGFEFDGTRYASINSCIDYFTKAAGVDKELLSQLVDIVSSDRFSYALRIAKLNKSVSSTKRSEIVEEVLQQESEQEEILLEQANSMFNPNVEEVNISGSIAPVFAIQWALANKVKDLAHLCALEDEYFDYFEHLGGPAAFMSYNGLQLYLESRQDPEWVEKSDPNKQYW
ncbi:hypothetical protein AB4559_15875 [Vibrio sp. 10N.222.51.C8]|uniref:hypothetical protein n=1 Tax=unclassified Vibrio TaxID=2614977 RepID=UPI000C840166|nr:MULTISPECIES: hypothetical protein [unclassified Vibrio]PMK21098.1 hypothetical protein BCU05_13190 [Vibrio sp. 10N.261.54.C3]PMN96674.1 hypothetical protein BCT21_15810 [Vibrio sp. 10N.222.55.F9]PMN97263.1 hypothetical protein BCT20_17890 [Vibrio sp. 10N.222.55.C12]PMO12967.1 hypothetical protein BCT17_15040 [Vibrio sp. 10N.222.54.F10]PMO20855.1 hypothetical protein BCT16_08025 [Vibrio sp. 10N.222.54.B6]